MYAWPTGGSGRSTHWRFGNGWPAGTKTVVPGDGSGAVGGLELGGGAGTGVKGPCVGTGAVPEVGPVAVDVGWGVTGAVVGVMGVKGAVKGPCGEVNVDVVGIGAPPSGTVPMNAFCVTAFT